MTTQVCHFKWGSWTHDTTHITINAGKREVDLEDYWANPWWELVETSVKKNSIKYPCCEDIYEDVTAYLTLRRGVTHGRIASAVITTWLILVVFIVGPSSAGERVVFAGLVFVALVVLSASLTATVPGASTTRLGRFLMAGMLITAIVAAVNGFLFRVSSKGTTSGDLKV